MTRTLVRAVAAATLAAGLSTFDGRMGSGSGLVETAPQALPSFRVPKGFVVEVVAEPPLVAHPVMANFDERGRLFVADHADNNLGGEPNAIRLLEDSAAEGRFDKYTVFADNLSLPTGLLWHRGSLYVTAAPSLWRLQETTEPGRAGLRQPIVTGFKSRDIAADIHAPSLGPDGRIYWAHGAFGGYEIIRPDGSKLTGQDGVICRGKPDGSDVEILCDMGSKTNLGSLVCTCEGEIIANVIPIHHNDALAHCVDGGVYFREPADPRKRSGALLPGVHFGLHVAPSGLVRYRGTAFGAAFQGNLFSAQFNTHKVQRHILERAGATFRIRTEDFLVSTDPDFHPTDVLEDADGSLIVVNTGGWFIKGCPTSRIAKPQVLGGIYRIRKLDAPKMADPRGQSEKWDRLTPGDVTALLDDPRWVVRDRAVEHLSQKAAVPALRQVLRNSPSVRARRNAVWALTRMEHKDARAALRLGLKDPDASVRLAAAHAAGLNRDDGATRYLLDMLHDEFPAVRRQAATALGRIRNGVCVPALLGELGNASDPFLEHALVYALIEIADRKATLPGLDNVSPRIRQGALIALDQMDQGSLTPEQVTPLLETSDSALQNTALTVLSSRGWARQAETLLDRWVGQKTVAPHRQESLRRALLALCKDEAIQKLLARPLQEAGAAMATRVFLLETMAQAPLPSFPAVWLPALTSSLKSPDDPVVRQAVVTLRRFQVRALDEELLKLAKNQNKPPDLRVVALGAVGERLPRLERDLFDFLLSRLDKEVPPLVRLEAAKTLACAPLDEIQLTALTEALAHTGNLETPRLLAAFPRAPKLDVGKKLVAALARAPALTSLTPDGLRQILKGFPEEVKHAARPLFKRLLVDVEKQQERLNELEGVLKGGTSAPGYDVFFGTKAACSTCHAIGADGGTLGPDLSKIGAIRTSRDLLEAIVFPSASLVQGYEAYTLATKDGRIHTGILKTETAEDIWLLTAERTEIRVPRAEIDTLERSKVSIMPQGIDAQLSSQELADLIAYLLARK